MSQLNGGPISSHSYGGLSERLRRSGQLSSHVEEIQTLHRVVAGLQQDILQCNTQRKRATDQLACLISLVKNAWEGDKEASKNVGKIVGVSPPEIEVDYSLQDSARVVAKVKPNVINRWARLSMGVLNREYKKRELDIEMRQRLYLHQRTSYLDHQMSLSLRHDALHNTSTVSAPCLTTSGQQVSSNSRQGSANTTRRRPISRPLYRQPTPHSEEEPLDVKVCFGDLLVASTATRSQLIPSQNGYNTDQVWRQKMERKNSVESEVAINNCCNEASPVSELPSAWTSSCPPPSGHYASPHRYAANDIFDASSVIHKIKADTPASRPTSGILKKPSFGRNIRPKSAVVVGNRPLKYETTRPLSAAPKPRPVFKTQNTEPFLRPKRSVNNSTREAKKMFDNDYLNNGEPVENHDAVRYSESKESCRNERTIPLTSAEAFQEELKKMSEMENDFVKGTIDLQKRLGINAYGFVL